MTKKQLIKKVKKLQLDDKKEKWIEKECLRLFESGAINKKDYKDNKDNYLLPKMVYCVALKNLAHQWAPWHNNENKEVVSKLEKI